MKIIEKEESIKMEMQFNNPKFFDNKKYKICKSSDYNFIFNKKTGFFARWGKTKEDDPIYAPSPEMLDLEISAGNIGTKEQMCKGKCQFCYKKNNSGTEPIYNMTFDEFKIIFDKIPIEILGQIAFGIMNISTNPDFFEMMKYTKEHGVIPNYTCHGLDMTPEYADKTAELCGAVAVSLINKEKTYDTIKMLTDRNMTQINCHYMLSMETYERAFEIVDDISTDLRLKKFNAIVFLQYKAKGRNPDSFHSVLDIAKYKKLTNYCEKKGIRYGFDSCSGPIFIESLIDTPNKEFTELFVEPCESFLFSFYINCKGVGYPCSFVEGVEEGIDVINCNNFLKDIWYSPQSFQWRKKLLCNNRNCPVYNLNFV